jgi:FAD-linked oxidoreductase
MITRRNLLSSLIATAGATAFAPSMTFAGLQSSDQKKIPWKNWSGSQICYPDARKAPATIDELRELIVAAPGNIRPVGSGHSFTALVPTDDTIVSISRLSGMVSHDATNNTSVIQAGTRLGDIGGPLAQAGQALINMPDIDEQTLAGALGTATHGTGAGIGCLPSFVEGLQLVTANGEVIECDRNNNPEIFKAARVNLGALGVITQVRMQNQASYRLKRELSCKPIEEILENADTLANENRNFEFYYIPFSGMGFQDTQNITTEPESSTEKTDQNDGVETLKTLRNALSWSSTIRELSIGTYMKTIQDEVTVANSWQNYATERNVRFNEMEYHLPRENGLQAFKEVREVVERDFPEVFFPFEVRYVKSDDIWLSPFFERETMSIAVHRYFDEDYKPMFKAVEKIFKKYGGRPHWGKINTMNGQELSAHYKHWDDFKEVRQTLDPQGKFLNPYLKSIFAV